MPSGEPLFAGAAASVGGSLAVFGSLAVATWLRLPITVPLALLILALTPFVVPAAVRTALFARYSRRGMGDSHC
jgi:hypothetical protein